MNDLSNYCSQEQVIKDLSMELISSGKDTDKLCVKLESANARIIQQKEKIEALKLELKNSKAKYKDVKAVVKSKDAELKKHQKNCFQLMLANEKIELLQATIRSKDNSISDLLESQRLRGQKAAGKHKDELRVKLSIAYMLFAGANYESIIDELSVSNATIAGVKKAIGIKEDVRGLTGRINTRKDHQKVINIAYALGRGSDAISIAYDLDVCAKTVAKVNKTIKYVM